jgi:hypothetical protein
MMTDMTIRVRNGRKRVKLLMQAMQYDMHTYQDGSYVQSDFVESIKAGHGRARRDAQPGRTHRITAPTGITVAEGI